MSHPRHSEPLPLGTAEHPYSKGLMARALVAVGVPLGRGYELAKRIDQDLVERGEQSVELERVRSSRSRSWAKKRASRRSGVCAAFVSFRSSTSP